MSGEGQSVSVCSLPVDLGQLCVIKFLSNIIIIMESLAVCYCLTASISVALAMSVVIIVCHMYYKIRGTDTNLLLWCDQY